MVLQKNIGKHLGNNSAQLFLHQTKGLSESGMCPKNWNFIPPFHPFPESFLCLGLCERRGRDSVPDTT